jgi:hypothetical protein
MGVTNREAVRFVTYGRDEELAELENAVLSRPEGSAQVMVGGYGIGKSHLCELLSFRLERQGYAVARLELGASHSRAEYPRYILEAIEKSLRVPIGDRVYEGVTDVALIRRAINVEHADFWDRAIVLRSHELFPGDCGLQQRIDYLRAELPLVSGDRFYDLYWMSVSARVPFELTAINRAAAELNCLAHDLKEVGVPGIVVLLDEAERSETLPRGRYRMERARDLIFGLALSSSNKDTSSLKHFRNESPHSKPYLPCGRSRIHTVFAFTYEWGLASDLAHRLGVTPLSLSPLGTAANDVLLELVIDLYHEAYGYTPHLTSEKVARLVPDRNAPDVRSTIRTIVSGLDYYRHLEEDACRG